MNSSAPRCTAFQGARRLASGSLPEVAVAAKVALDEGSIDPILTFDDATGRVIDLDTRGTVVEVATRYSEATVGEAGTPRGPGRPKLGVIPREITLLPRHWDWLNAQPGGASVALRKLVETARRTNQETDRRRVAQETTYRFVTAMAGHEPGFEEALRALFALDREAFETITRKWPRDIRDHALYLAAVAFRKD
jgi:uncharacterized protein